MTSFDGQLVNWTVSRFHSQPNCFVYVDTKQQRQFNISEKDVIECKYGETVTPWRAFFSVSPSAEQQGCCAINGLYAKKLHIDENQQLSIVKIHRNCAYASSITIKAISLDDWQILELNLDCVASNLLQQIKVCFTNQIFPIWIESKVCVFVKICSFEPSPQEFTCLNELTRLVIEPFQVDTVTPARSVLANWSYSFAVSCSESSARHSRPCSSPTVLEVDRIDLQSCHLDDTNISGTYLVAIHRIASPMQLTLSSKPTPTTSGTTDSTRLKFLQTIDSSYPNEYFAEKDLSFTLYAHLLVMEQNVETETASRCASNPTVRVPPFLRRQLRLFEPNAKVHIAALSALPPAVPTHLDWTTKKLTLKTNYKGNSEHVRTAFVRFVDNVCDCLCPFVLTNRMTLELEYQNETITCLVWLDGSEHMAISSNTLFHDLLQIDVEVSVDVVRSRFLSMSPKLFNLKLIECDWFTANAAQVQTHLRTSPSDRSLLHRNICLEGAKGSGKTTLCKWICNAICGPTGAKCTYYFVNCQHFMSKTAANIYDSLKLVYNECLWSPHTYSLVILDDIDLLFDNKSLSVDPALQLYHAQIIESIKEILNYVWEKSMADQRIQTIITCSMPLQQMPPLFHCIDEHGHFSEFIRMKAHVVKEQTVEIIQRMLVQRGATFDDNLVDAIVEQTEGYVFRDLEKIVDKICLSSFMNSTSGTHSHVKLKEAQSILYNYNCINMEDTQFYKAQSTLSWRMIGGLESIKESLTQALIWPIKYKRLFTQLSMKQSAGVLLYGPSGCGKTLIASALANESKLNFISVKGPELLSKYIGNSERNVRELFNKAEKAKPCVIFFDEFDSLAPKRGHDSTGVTDRVVNQLLTQLDGVEQLDGVYLLAASSRPDLIDQALLRPGRIDNFFYIGFPQKTEIVSILKLYCREMQLDDDVDLKALSDLCTDFSGADLKSVVCDALVRAFHRAHKTSLSTSDKDKVTNEEVVRSCIRVRRDDLLVSIENVSASINRKERARLRILYQNWRNSGGKSDNAEKRPRVTLA